jgi:hypothetical protein
LLRLLLRLLLLLLLLPLVSPPRRSEEANALFARTLALQARRRGLRSQRTGRRPARREATLFARAAARAPDRSPDRVRARSPDRAPAVATPRGRARRCALLQWRHRQQRHLLQRYAGRIVKRELDLVVRAPASSAVKQLHAQPSLGCVHLAHLADPVLVRCQPTQCGRGCERRAALVVRGQSHEISNLGLRLLSPARSEQWTQLCWRTPELLAADHDGNITSAVLLRDLSGLQTERHPVSDPQLPRRRLLRRHDPLAKRSALSASGAGRVALRWIGLLFTSASKRGSQINWNQEGLRVDGGWGPPGGGGQQ